LPLGSGRTRQYEHKKIRLADEFAALEIMRRPLEDGQWGFGTALGNKPSVKSM
jgi:hypothetical protein